MNKSLTKIFRSKTYTALLMLMLLNVIGVTGYKFISDLSWIDAVYMTVITVTTVGFGEVHPLNLEGKIFTVFLILTSVIVVGYALSIITEYILSKNNLDDIRQKRMQKKIDAMKNHIIICGYGRNGKQATEKLIEYGKSFIVIEKDKAIIDKFQTNNLPFVYGNANEDEILEKAGITKASTLICALPSDADNLFIVLSARQLNKNLKIISRASQETSYNKLKLAGADNVILPYKIGGEHMASLVVVPDLVEFIDNLKIGGAQNVNIEEIKVEQLYDFSEIKSIRDLDLRRKTGCNVIGFKDVNGEYLVNPESDTPLTPGSKIIVLGRPEQINLLNKEFNIEL